MSPDQDSIPARLRHKSARNLGHVISAQSGPLTAGLLRVIAVLFGLLGLAAAIVIVPTLIESGADGVFSIMTATDNLAGARGGNPASGPDDAYAGHILSVVIISLTALTLLAALFTVASILGLNAHASMLRREIRDDITESAYDVVRDMTHISAETHRAQVKLDLSAHE